MANLATRAGMEGTRRLTIYRSSHLTKAEIIQLGTHLGVDDGPTISCYGPSPHGIACGVCDACLLQAEGIAEGGPADPALLSMVSESGHLDLVEREGKQRLFTGSTYEQERQPKPSGKLDEAL